jgi:Flp pilus assembly protein TadB
VCFEAALNDKQQGPHNKLNRHWLVLVLVLVLVVVVLGAPVDAMF